MELYSKSGTLLMDISPNPSSVLTEEVGGECSVSLSFMQPVFRKLDVGDYIEVSGTRYTIRSPYRPKQKNTQAYEYSVKLYAPIHEAEDTLMLFTKGESTSEFSYDGSPREHLQLWVDNMNRRAGSKVWSIGTVITADNQVIDYRNMKCWEAAFGSSGIAATFGTEMWADGFVINLCRAERGEQVELGYMKGLTNLSQEENGELRFFTRLFPLGSTRNINASTYGSARLQLPSRAKYVDKNADLYGIIEDTEESAFADIYPKYTGAVASVRTEEKTNEDGRKYTVYFFKDSGMDWNPEDCQIAGLDFMLRFQTGELAGRGNDEGSFQAAWHKDTKEWEIINVYPDESTQLPGGAIIPKQGDKYIPWNFALPQTYITAAEKAYEKAVNDYLATYSFDTNKYNGTTDRNYIERNGTSLMLGQNVRLLSDKYFTSGHKDTRIIKVVRKLNDLSQAAITCADEVGAGWKSSVDNSLSSLRYEVARQAEQYVYDVIKSFEGKTPSDKNIFSALKSLKTHLRKDVPDSTMYLQKFLGGIITTFLQSPEFVSGAMGHGFIIRQNEDGTTYAEVDKLMVRMKAVFQSLEIMKTELAGASFMFNASGARMTIVRTERFDHQPAEFADGSEAVFADGSRAVFAGAGEPFIRCWFVADDGETAIENRFRVGNLVRSQTFNIKAGAYEGVSNRFWWREVIGVGDDYIDIAIARCAEGSDLPAEGDVCVQLGDLNDIDYQSAIVLSAYGEDAPYLTMYQGINSYSLAERDMFSIGYDKMKKECYVRNYGRMYMGDRTRNRYFDFDGNRFVVAADEIRLGGRNVEDIIIDETRITQKTLDATALDENKYYPITFNLWTGSPKVRISLVRTLNRSFGVPSYASHGEGFDVRCVWTTNADGWGTAETQRNIEYYSLRWVKPDELVVGDIGQMSHSSNEYIYVRGGSKYKVIVEGEINTDIILHTDTYTVNEQTLHVRNQIENVPVPNLKETGIDIYNRTVKVTADNFYVSSTSGTPIAVFTTNKDGKPVLKAEYIDVDDLYVKHLDGAKGSLESGSIGGFELANGRIGTIFSADSSYGLSISNTDLHVGNSSAMVFLGPGSSNTGVGTSSAVRIESNRTGRTVIQLAYNDASLYSAGLRIKSTGGRERKYGVISELPSLGSAFVGTRLSFHAIYSVGQGITMDLSKYSIFLVSSYIGDCSISLPSESQVCEFFGLPQGFENSLPSDFAVEFTIKCTGSSQIRVMGVYNANERLVVEGYPMRAGDSLHLLLMKQGGFRYHCLYYNTDQ